MHVLLGILTFFLSFTTALPNLVEKDLHYEELSLIKDLTYDRQKFYGYNKLIQQHNEGIDTPLTDVLFEGDDILTRKQSGELLESSKSRHKRQAIVPTVNSALWNDTIHYIFHNTFPAKHQTPVRKAIERIASLTCVKFQEISGDSSNNFPKVLEFNSNGGCVSTSIGMTKSPVQTIYLGQGCETGTSVHEIFHALGIDHTHSRHDRDEYIKMHSEKIPNGWGRDYQKDSETEFDNMGIPYDYGSIMHYGGTAQTGVVMEAKDENHKYTMGSQIDSFYDFLLVNKLYKCTNICESDIICANGGYLNPSNCLNCICIRGYAGQLCNEKAGVEINLADGVQITKSGVLERDFADYPLQTFTYKYFWLKAAKNMEITISVNNIREHSADLCREGCNYGGIEIKTKEDQRLTGYRFCCGSTVVKVKSTMVPMIVYHRRDLQVYYNFTAKAVSYNFDATWWKYIYPLDVPP